MSAEFVDTNILVYGHDLKSGWKREIAGALLNRLVEERNGALSVQVLSEFFSVCSRKTTLPPDEAENIVKELGTWRLHSPQHADLIAAWHLRRRHGISWWDALIVQSAE